MLGELKTCGMGLASMLEDRERCGGGGASGLCAERELVASGRLLSNEAPPAHEGYWFEVSSMEPRGARAAASCDGLWYVSTV